MWTKTCMKNNTYKGYALLWDYTNSINMLVTLFLYWCIKITFLEFFKPAGSLASSFFTHLSTATMIEKILNFTANSNNPFWTENC